MSRYNRRTYSRFTDPFEFNIEYKNRYGFQPYIMIDRLMKNNSPLSDTEEEKETVDSPYLTEDNLSFPGDDSAWEQLEFIL